MPSTDRNVPTKYARRRVRDVSPRDTTLVTALYDIASREPTTGRRSLDDYLRLACFVVEQPMPLVCFCEPGIATELTEARASLGLERMTRVVPRALEGTRRFADLARIEDARRRRPIRNANPAKDSPLYTVLTWSKLDFLAEVVDENPFGTSHVSWVDAGIVHVASIAHVDEDRVLDLRCPGIRVLALRAWSPGISDEPGQYCSVIRGHLAAGFLSGSRGRTRELVGLGNATLDRLLGRGIAPTDEQLLALLADSRPDLFDLYHGDYGQILENARVLRGGGENLRFQMTESLARRDWAWAEKIGTCVGEALDAGTFDCDAARLSDILESWFTAAWYSGYPDLSAARNVANRYLRLVDESPELRAAYETRRDAIDANFALLDPPAGIR